jgi:hypothetical protein
MALSMQEVLDALAENKNPEEAFAAGITDNVEKVAGAADATTPVVEEKGTPETPTEATPEATDDMAKVAEADAQGRIMARSFYDELNKLAVAPVAPYPADPGAIPNNPALEIGRGEPAQPQAEKSQQINGIIASLTAANKVGAGEIATPAGAQPVAHTDPQEGNMPLVYDQAAAQERAAVPGAEAVKTGELAGAEKIVTSLYNKYVAEEK